MLITTVAHKLNFGKWFTQEDDYEWQPQGIDVEYVKVTDYVWIPSLRLAGEVDCIRLDPFAINDYDAEWVAAVNFYDPDLGSCRTDYFYEGEIYVIDRIGE